MVKKKTKKAGMLVITQFVPYIIRQEDELNTVVTKKVTTEKGEREKHLGFCPSLLAALQLVASDCANNAGAVSVEEYIDSLNDTYNRFADIAASFQLQKGGDSPCEQSNESEATNMLPEE